MQILNLNSAWAVSDDVLLVHIRTDKNSDFPSNLIGLLQDNHDDIMRRVFRRPDKVILCRLGSTTPCDEQTQLSIKKKKILFQSKNHAIPQEDIFFLKSREKYLNSENWVTLKTCISCSGGLL